MLLISPRGVMDLTQLQRLDQTCDLVVGFVAFHHQARDFVNGMNHRGVVTAAEESGNGWI